jgi:hypothetical protein
VLVVSAILKCSDDELCPHHHSYWWEKCLEQGLKIIQKTGSYLKILDARKVKYSKFHTEKPHYTNFSCLGDPAHNVCEALV